VAVSRRSWTILAAVLGGLAIAATLLITTPRSSGPKLDAPGDHYSVSAADSANGPVSVGKGVFVGADQHHDRSPVLRTIKPQPVRALPADEDQAAEGVDRAPLVANDPVVQTSQLAAAMPSTNLNFEGIDFPGVVCNCAPPDTNGEVGATQYVQIVNEGFEVFNKSTGASMYGPAAITTIWSGAGNVCATAGDGDPVVLYDQFAQRWLISQFAGSGTPTDECIAVSTTSDATGTWNRYDFHLGTNFMDYPHGGVWPDGYYFSFNVFNSAGTSYLGPQPVVFDRAKMLAGQPATFQTVSPLGGSVDPFLPADVDGSTAPPANAPESFVKWPGNGTYQTYHYHVDWVAPANTTFSSFSSPAAAAFTQLCAISRSCVPQPNTTAGLDAIADRLMFRLSYRNFGDHEAVVGNFTVSSGGVAAVRWFELRNVTSGPETVYQQGTYQPDSVWRWMGSAAMDHNGDIAVGYSASSSSVFPSLRYAGRLVGDALGTLAQGEAVLLAGLGSQTGTSNRWGDYADMTVDPVDDCTFWFTSEYYPSGNSQFNWRTRIGSFSFPSCSGVAQTLTSISVAPATASVTVNKTQQFSATAYDQFGQPMSPQPTFSWTVSGGGSIGASTGLFTAGSSAGGPFTVTATSGSVNGTASVTITSPPPDFSFNVNPTTTSVRRGSTATYTIAITRLNGFTGSITFSLSGQPSGTTVTFSPNPTTGNSVTLTIKTATSTSRRTYNMTITGVSGTLNHSTPIQLTVTK
jgi:hypothetical protein